MKKYIFIIAFFVTAFLTNAQENKIHITEWVNQPMKSDYKKPLIFVDFWATWCGPCIGSMRHTKNLSNIFKDKVLFLYLSDEPSGKVQEFMNKKKKTFFSGVDNSGYNIKNFDVNSIPYSVLLGPDGEVLWDGNPADMTIRKLQKYSLRFRKKGDKNRIFEPRVDQQEEMLESFSYKSVRIDFRESDNVGNEYSILDDGRHYFSGNMEYLISFVFDVSSSQVIYESTTNKSFYAYCDSEDVQSFKLALRDFVEKKYGVEIITEQKTEEVLLLKETGKEVFFGKEMYDYEKGDKAFIIDEMSLTIDNATILEMTELLSEYSEKKYIYEGDNREKYDWNIRYNNTIFTNEQLSNEIGFEVKKVERNVFYYRVK